MSSIFTRIIKGQIPSHKIIEDEDFYSFLDIRPINPGHTLVIPKKEVDNLFGLEDPLLSKILIFAKKIVTALEASVECKRVGVMVAGLDVPHAHIHLIPIINEGDLTFSRAKPAVPADLAAMVIKIHSNLV